MRMRRIRHCFLMSLLVCASPFVAHAQWAATITEHDWRLTVGGHSYGVVERVRYVGVRLGGKRTTTIYVGRYTAETRLPAALVATVTLLPVGVLGLFVLRGLVRQGSES